MSSKRAFSTKARQVLEFEIGSYFNNVSISSYGCTREVWKARDKHLECPPNFTNASATLSIYALLQGRTRLYARYARAYLKKSRVKNNDKIRVKKWIMKTKEKRKDRIDETVILRAQFGSIHLATDCQFNSSFYYRYWWNTRIFPFTKKSHLHRGQWRYYFHLSRVRTIGVAMVTNINFDFLEQKIISIIVVISPL